MPSPRIDNFDDFWPYYLRAHRNPGNRALHYAGTSAAIATFVTAVLTGNLLLIASVPVVGYGPSWIGHFLVEGNRPATFGYARYSLLGDFKMLGMAITGKLGAELARVEQLVAHAE